MDAPGVCAAARAVDPVREVVTFMVSADFGMELSKQNPGWISASRDFPLAEYQLCTTTDPATRTCVSNDLTRSLAELVDAALDGDAFRFDGSDLMPLDVGTAFWAAMVEFVGEGPDNLDELLAQLDSVWGRLAP
jgi:alpha-glucoside transport system substrate-binding protein